MIGLQTIKNHTKQYFANLHFMESPDLHKALNSKILHPNVLIPVNKEAKTFFSLLSLTLTKIDHGRCSLKTAVPMFYRLQERLHLVFTKSLKNTFKRVHFCRQLYCKNELLEIHFSTILPDDLGS